MNILKKVAKELTEDTVRFFAKFSVGALIGVAILQFSALNLEIGATTPWYKRLIESLTEAWGANLIVGIVAGFVMVAIWRSGKK